MSTNAIKKQLHLYFGVDGTLLDKQGDLSANALDDETFIINAYIQDGVVDNQTTLINFTPQDKVAYTSDWFAMFYRGLVPYVVPTESEPRVFAQFQITVPSIVLLVKSGKDQFTQRLTIIQRYGNTHLGNFETVTDLNTEYPPTQVLDENNDVAFVYSNESGETTQVGFYQVEYGEDLEAYFWVKKETILYNLSTKQYNFLGLTVNVGFSNPRGVPTVAQSTIYQLMQELSYQSVKIDLLETEMEEAQLDISNIENGTTIVEKSKRDQNGNIIDETYATKVELGVVESDLQGQVDDVVDGTQTVKKAQQDASGNVITTTYETKADATSKKSEIDGRLNTSESEITKIKYGTTIVEKSKRDQNGNIIDLTYATKTENNQKVDKTQKIIGIDLQDDILIDEFRTAIGNATQSLAGLLSAEDKTHLDGLVALLESSDGNNVVDTIGEILAIFQNYPEGADLVTILQGKVDKVVGKGLSTNDFTDALKTKLDGLLNGSQYYDKDYIDSLKDQNGWQSQLLTLTPLTNGQTITTATLQSYDTLKLLVRDTNTDFVDTDSVEATLLVIGDKIQLSDETVYLEIGTTNSTFNAPSGWQLQIVGIKYTELKAVETTYDNTTSGLVADNVQEAIDELEDEKVPKTDIVDNLTTDDATKVLSAKQGKVLQDTTEKLANKAIDFSVINDTKYPTTKAVAEMLLNLPIAELNNHTLREVFEGGNLVVNGDFNSISGWTLTNVSISGGKLVYNSTSTGYALNNSLVFTQNHKYYISFNVNVISRVSGDYGLRVGNVGSYTFITTNKLGNQFVSGVWLEDEVSPGHLFGGINNGNGNVEFDNLKIIEQTSLGISALTVQQMDYWFQLYQDISNDSERGNSITYGIYSNGYFIQNLNRFGLENTSLAKLNYYYDLYQYYISFELD